MTKHQMPKTTFGDAFRFLLRGLLPALAVAAAAATAAFFISRTPEPLYRSTAILLATRSATGYFDTNIIEPTQVDLGIYRTAVFEGGLLETALLKVFGEEPTRKESDAWQRDIRIRVDEHLISGLVRIEVDHESPELARDVAAALADSLLAWDRERVGKNIQVTAAALSRSVSLLGAQIAVADQSGDNETVQVLSATREQRLAQLRAADALRLSAVVVGLLEPFKSAVLDSRPINNRTTFFAAIAFAVFLAATYVVMLLVRLIDPRIRTAVDLANATGRMPITTIRNGTKRPEFLEAVGRISIALQGAPLRATASSDSSRKDGRVVVVASSTGIKERSLLSRILAAEYSRAGWRVLLVDADLKQGIVSRAMPSSRQGVTLTELLRGVEFIDSGAPANDIEMRLDFIPAGPVPVDGAAILLMRRISWLISQWRSAYDIVVIDSTALASSAGTLVMARDADLILLVAKKHETRLAAVQKAVGELEAIGANSIGAVLVGATIWGDVPASGGREEGIRKFEVQGRAKPYSSRARVVQRPRR